jgi:glutamine amidotransferase
MIAVVDYNAGNLTSVKLALEKIGQECVITSEKKAILASERLIFPGVGAAGAAMQTIKERGLDRILREYYDSGKPFLGICLGAQIILESSLENDNTTCLGLIPGTTGLFPTVLEESLKVPQIGWNQVEFKVEHVIFAGIPSGSEFYFVHSYYPVLLEKDHQMAATTYGDVTFASVLGRSNLVACQFHPEKSGRWGLKLLENFCQWKGM